MLRGRKKSERKDKQKVQTFQLSDQLQCRLSLCRCKLCHKANVLKHGFIVPGPYHKIGHDSGSSACPLVSLTVREQCFYLAHLNHPFGLATENDDYSCDSLCGALPLCLCCHLGCSLPCPFLNPKPTHWAPFSLRRYPLPSA